MIRFLLISLLMILLSYGAQYFSLRNLSPDETKMINEAIVKRPNCTSYFG